MSNNIEWVFVPASAAERGEVAAFLLALCSEKGISTKVIRTAARGYTVPAELITGVEGELLVGEPEIPEFVFDETKTPPPGWDDPLPKVDIEPDEEGNLVVKELNYSEVRAWAKENDIPVSDKGRISHSVLDAYLEAN